MLKKTTDINYFNYFLPTIVFVGEPFN